MATESKVTGKILTAQDYLNNKKWVQRTAMLFNVCDCDKDGVVTINDLVLNVKKYSHLNPDPKVIERCRLAQVEFAAEVGVKPGISVTKEEYVKNYANLAPREVAKVRSGEGSLLHKARNRLFDVIDADHDGTVSQERYRELAIATEIWNPELIDVLYNLLDKYKIGKLERKVISDLQYRSTFTLEEVLPGTSEAFDPFSLELNLEILWISCKPLTAEDYLNNKEWIARIEKFFDVNDSDKDGVVTINDLVHDVRKYSHLHPDPKVIERWRLAQMECAAEFGVHPGVSVTKEEFVRNVANLAPGEVAKVKSGEGSIFHKLLNRVFDMIDTDHDGTVSKERYREFATATQVWKPEFIDFLYDLMDTNKSGELERKELCDYQYKRLLTLEEIPGKSEEFAELKPLKT